MLPHARTYRPCVLEHSHSQQQSIRPFAQPYRQCELEAIRRHIIAHRGSGYSPLPLEASSHTKLFQGANQSAAFRPGGSSLCRELAASAATCSTRAARHTSNAHRAAKPASKRRPGWPTPPKKWRLGRGTGGRAAQCAYGRASASLEHIRILTIHTRFRFDGIQHVARGRRIFNRLEGSIKGGLHYFEPEPVLSLLAQQSFTVVRSLIGAGPQFPHPRWLKHRPRPGQGGRSSNGESNEGRV